MNTIVTNLTMSWKSTVGMLCTIALAALGPLTTVDFVNSGGRSVSFKVYLVAMCLTAGLKAAIGAMTQDADKVLTRVPGTDKTEAAAAHPVPDDPTKVVVTPVTKSTEDK